VNSNRKMPNVAIIGRPNVGKSALFNRLIGRQRAIVHDQPGVTRDRMSATCTAGTNPFTVWDTGGIGGAGESELIRQVRGTVDVAVQESDVLLFLVDAQHGLSPIDQELARQLRRSRKPVVLVINKIDHPKHEDLAAEFDSLGFERSVSISAAHGQGISELLELIENTLGQGGAPSISPALEPAASEPPHSESAALLIAIVGRPNVGKSSLINSITRTERAIVSELPGTTRDAIDIAYQRENEKFVFIDTAGMRKRASHSSSVEVFSVMRSERSIRRANLCVLAIDIISGVTAQDKKIAGLIQDARKSAILLINKFDLVKPAKSSPRRVIEGVVEDTRQRLFFLDYAPVLVTSAISGEHVDKLFRLIKKVERASKLRIGTGPLNRLFRAAFAANPPPMVGGRRLKLFYAAQASGGENPGPLQPPEFVLFVNDPRLLGEPYRRYLEAQIRAEQPYPGLPIRLTLRPRADKTAAPSRRPRAK
jgi:GTPase